MLGELVFEIEELLRPKHLVNVFLVDSDMVDLYQYSSSVVLDPHEPTFLGFDIKLENLTTSGRKVPGVFEDVETDEVATEQALDDFSPVSECSVYIGAWKVRMLIEPNIGIIILPLQVQRSQQQRDIMDPY